MRIAIVTHCVRPNDGQGRVNYEVARAAALAGHDVHLITAEAASDLISLPNVRWWRAGHGPLPTALLRNAWFAITSGLALRRARKQADVVIVNGFVTIGRSDINAVHFVHSGWSTSPYYEPGRGAKGLYQRVYSGLNARLERWAFADSGMVVAVSERVAGELSAIAVPASKIRVVTNGVDVGQFHPGETDRSRLGLPEGITTALFVGDITTDRKNLGSVLKALQAVDDLLLVVVGDTTASPFPEMARAMGLASRVLFLGFRRDVAEIMRACDLFVFPSRYEACSLVMLEALASGLPVVTAETTGGAELIDAGSGFKLDDPDDVEGLARAMRTLAGDPAKRRSMATSARRRALDLTWDVTAAGYLRLAQDIVSARTAGGAVA